MGLFDFLTKKKQGFYIPPQQAFVYGPGRVAQYPDWNNRLNIDRYANNDDVYSVIRYLATTAARIQSYAYKDDEPEDEITELLQNPSATLSRFEFYEAVNTYLYQEGEAFIALDERLGVNAGTRLLIIPPSEMVVMAVNNAVVGYQHVRSGAVIANYELTSVAHIKYFNPDPMSLRGLSPLRVLHRRLTQAGAIDDQLTAQMQNGGVNTIVSDKGAYDDGPAVTNARKDSFYRFLRDPANKGTPYFAMGEMQALNIGSSITDMQLNETMQIPFKKLCNAFGTSDILFNSDSASTESNVKEMTKRTYTNTILPNIHRINDGLSWLLGLARKGIVIKEDISEIPELQDDMKMLVDTLNTAWWLTPNQRLEAMKYDRRDNPIFDEPWIPGGLSPLSDLEMGGDVEDLDGDYNL